MFKIKEIVKTFLSSFNFFITKNINNKKFRIPIIRNLGFSNLQLEDGLWKSDVFKNILPLKAGAVADIGVNIGQTLLELRSVNEDRMCYGFEPNPFCVYYLNILIEKNKIPGTVIIPTGLYNETKIASFNLSGDADTGGTIIENLRPDQKTVLKLNVPVFKFEDIAKDIKIDKLSIIKIDVEGAEYEVLESMKGIIIRDRPFVLIEILWAHNREKLKDFDKLVKNLFTLINEIDCSLFQILKTPDLNKIKSIKKVKDIKAEVYSLDNKDLCDYLIVHREDEGLLPFDIS